MSAYVLNTSMCGETVDLLCFFNPFFMGWGGGFRESFHGQERECDEYVQKLRLDRQTFYA